jgi:hypothetical protein
MADARKAIDFAPESAREGVKAEVAKTAMDIARACFSITGAFTLLKPINSEKKRRRCALRTREST